MNDDALRQSIEKSRARLLRVLAEITTAAGDQALVRCPYRTRTDVCTFRGECQNQIGRPRSRRHCAGGRLDPTPASATDIERALT